MSLLIDKFLEGELEKEAAEATWQEFEKTAEEVAMEKVADEIHALDQSRVLVDVGEQMLKIAEELGNEHFEVLAYDTYNLGERIGSCLSKTASESEVALDEALEITNDLYKVACVYDSIAQEVNNEEFSKLANSVIDVSNDYNEQLNDLYTNMEELEKDANYKEVAYGVLNKIKNLGSKAKEVVREEAIKGHRRAGGFLNKIKNLGSKKAEGVLEFIKEHPKKVAAGAGAAAALGAAGYGYMKKKSE